MPLLEEYYHATRNLNTLCRAAFIVRSVNCEKCIVQLVHILVFRVSHKGAEIEAQADIDVHLREIVAVDQNFADLVGVIRIFAVFGVVAFGEVSRNSSAG